MVILYQLVDRFIILFKKSNALFDLYKNKFIFISFYGKKRGRRFYKCKMDDSLQMIIFFSKITTQNEIKIKDNKSVSNANGNML
jgi:hypothetical protein